MRADNIHNQKDFPKDPRKLILSLVLGLLCLSCGSNNEKGSSQTTNDTPVLPINLIYNDAVVEEKSDHILIPVSVSPDKNQEREGIFNRTTKKTKNYYNIIFYSKTTGETSLLLEKQAIIKSFDYIEIKQENQTKGFWIYKVIEDDTNSDKSINNKDAIIAYLSDSSGKNFRQISPDNTQLINWESIPQRQELILKILNDTDKDKNFSELDRATFIKVDLNKPQVGTEIIKDKLETKIKSYIK